MKAAQNQRLCASFSLFRQAKEAEGADNAVMLLTHLTTFIMMLQDERVSEATTEMNREQTVVLKHLPFFYLSSVLSDKR